MDTAQGAADCIRPDIGKAKAVAAARADAKTAAALEGMQVLKEIYVMPAEQFKNIIIATVYRVFELFRCKVFGRIRPKTLHFAFAACVRKSETGNNQWT